MLNIFELLFDKNEIFLLVLVRTSGIFVVSPFFSSQNVPNTLKAGFSFILSILLTLSLDIEVEILRTTFAILIIKELMVGLIIGFISYAFFSTFYVTGQIVDMKIGFGMVNVIDPQHRVQVPVMGNFYYILAFLLLLTINGHHAIINGLIDSYKFIPIGKFTFNLDTGFFLIDILSKSFITGFKLSAPVVVTIFLTDLLLGILARTIPQMNVFVVGLPLKILIGLIVIGLSIPIFYSLTTGVFNNTIEEIYNFLNSFVKG
ncbi:Flagellar biosynthetic protein fliR [[Clostridium] ultunense Esp]|uniref:Flagellar biosynthetic protein FliR n=1 Tax=[Clostridium] ultunense Esp TaxID=1288971 RepID=M1ZGU6_9FIRM|nr:flagellar biosynthetic protein FliR [Schnuerera ultunensis]CCQ93027.1 Flagellar biosynthetic protein fliR [[Clostridium] ultunense Esp]SHD77030.1 Flagellar biosynthetic protein fliR [[Clostridium] ultunense Esp]